ncbi:unnamed protein product [Protopolystoma xenopodis]|uniref:Uncharacterized protein n=1 Tax=Protopolystoma xenopodis TaxID=117903 RepID=A0A3S5BZ21_9PLAT|nr:unnamed protein product [Protopolystoma xenopodis]
MQQRPSGGNQAQVHGIGYSNAPCSGGRVIGNVSTTTGQPADITRLSGPSNVSVPARSSGHRSSNWSSTAGGLGSSAHVGAPGSGTGAASGTGGSGGASNKVPLTPEEEAARARARSLAASHAAKASVAARRARAERALLEQRVVQIYQSFLNRRKLAINLIKQEIEVFFLNCIVMFF